MACGTPAIVYRSTGLPEVLSDFPELIANPRDVDDVIRIIKLVENGNIDLSRMENVVKEKYDIKKQYEHYIDLYECLELKSMEIGLSQEYKIILNLLVKHFGVYIRFK